MKIMIRVLLIATISLCSRSAFGDGAVCAGEGYLGYLDFELTSRFHEDWVEDIEIVGDIAYVACRDAGVRVVDISNPSRMEVISRYQTDGDALDIVCVEQFGDKVLYIGGRGTGIDVVNVNDPMNPTRITNVTGFDAWQLEYFEDIAGTPSLMAREFGAIRFYDITFPFLPVLRRTYTDDYSRSDFEIQRVDSRRYMYHLTDAGQVEVSILGGGYVMTQIDTIQPSDDAAGMAVSGDYMYLGLDDRTFEVVEMQPDRVGWSVVENLDLPFAAWSIEVEGDQLIASAGVSEFVLMDIAFPDSPDLIAVVQTLGRTRALGRSGDIVLSGDEGVVSSMSVADPVVFNNDPVLSQFDFGTNAGGYGEVLLTTGSRVIVAHDDKLHLFDVAGDVPVLLDSTGTSTWGIRAFDVVGDTCYMMDGDDFRTFDISTGQFQQLSRISSNLLPHSSRDICVLDDVAYIAMGFRKLARVDVSDPANPSIIPTGLPYNSLTQIERTFAIEGGPHLFYLNDGDITGPYNTGNEGGTKIGLDHEGYAYYVHTESNYNETHIAIYHPDNVGVPAPPAPVHAIHRPLRFLSYDSHGDNVDLAFTPDHLLLAEFKSGVTIYELGDRLQLGFAGVVHGDWTAYGLAAQDERAYIRTGESFIIVDISACAPPCQADLNGDGELNFFDVSAFLTAYNTQDPLADFTGDGQFNFFDVSAFLQAYNAGCP